MMLARFAALGSKPPVYATLDPATAYATLSNGNLTLASNPWKGARSTISKSAGNWYWEYTLNTGGSAVHLPSIANAAAALSTYFGADTNSKGWQTSGQVNYNNAVPQTFGSAATGNVVGMALNAATGSVDVYVQGVYIGTMAQAVTGPYFAGASISSVGVGTFNFGASAFAYGPPSGYNPGLYD